MAESQEEIRRFVERLGRFFEQEGGSRSSGLILAWLLVSERAQSLDEISDELHISKAAASLGTRFWERAGMVERINVRGDRRVYYAPCHDVAGAVRELSAQKAQAFLDIIDNGLDAVGEDHPQARARLGDVRQFYTLMLTCLATAGTQDRE